jgi:hypothetical protein
VAISSSAGIYMNIRDCFVASLLAMTVGWLSSRELFNGELVAIPNPLSLRAFCRAEGVAISVVKKIKKPE